MTVKEASCSGPELPTMRHTYSPESAGETWCSRSREPWVCERGRNSHHAKVPGAPRVPKSAVPGAKLSLESQEPRAPAGREKGASFTDSYMSK